MEITSKVLILLLKHTKMGPVSLELVKKDLSLPHRNVEELLLKLQREDLTYLSSGYINVNTFQRLKLAMLALEKGADFERVCSFLDWKEFENVVGEAFEAQGYTIIRNLRFKQGGRKWELDIVGCRRPLVVCADCKHWRRGVSSSKMIRAVEEQVERTIAFSSFLPNPAFRADCTAWRSARFIPIMVSLVPASFRFHDQTPIVPILQLQDFLMQIPMTIDNMRFFDKAQTYFKAVL